MANSSSLMEQTVIVQWNCRSIISKLESFTQLVHDANCDIFALSETWLNPGLNLNFRDFNIIRSDRDDSHGGVLLGIRKCYSFYRINTPPVSGIEIVACQIQVKGRDLSVASIYIPPRVAVNYRQLESITEVLSEPRLILGDLNSHGMAWGESYDDARAPVIYDLCDNFNMCVLNSGEATRVPPPPARETRLDLSISSNSLRLDCTWKVIQDPHGSDHLPINISISNGSTPAETIDITYDLTRNIDWKKYSKTVLESTETVRELPPLEEYKFLVSLIYESAVEAQTKRFCHKFRARAPNIWWDDDCKNAYATKSSAFIAWRRDGRITLFHEYLSHERKFKSLIIAKKKGYWRKFVENLSRESSMSTLWKVAKSMRNRSASNEDTKCSDRWIFDFAKKVCPDSVPGQEVFWEMSSDDLEPQFSMADFSIALLCCNNSAPGPDKIKFNLLKNLPDAAKKRLLNLFNALVEQNIVPDEWRRVKVIAIQKPGKPVSDHNSYRPISMLSCIRKLLEKMILRRLDHWAEANQLLSPTQYGFRRGKETNDCLALLATEMDIAFGQKQQMTSVFLDIKGAFD